MIIAVSGEYGSEPVKFVMYRIENGRIAEAGTHMELLVKKGIYHKLFSLQMLAMRNIGIDQ